MRNLLASTSFSFLNLHLSHIAWLPKHAAYGWKSDETSSWRSLVNDSYSVSPDESEDRKPLWIIRLPYLGLSYSSSYRFSRASTISSLWSLSWLAEDSQSVDQVLQVWLMLQEFLFIGFQFLDWFSCKIAHRHLNIPLLLKRSLSQIPIDFDIISSVDTTQ